MCEDTVDTNDVFVSYAHIDDVAPIGAPEGWVTIFVTQLKHALDQKLGGRSVIWKDGRINPNAQVAPALGTALRASRTLLVFMSPSYQNSKWCQQELITFLESNGTTKNKESVFLVEVEPIPHYSLPPRLRELTPVEFWVQDDLARPVPRRLGHPIPNPDEQNPYWLRLNELAHSMSAYLKAASKSTKPVVWLAEPSDDLFDRWEAVATAARQAGCEVRPAGPDAYPRISEAGYRESVRSDLRDAILAVQLLSERAAVRTIDGSVSYIALQSELANEWARDPTKRFLQWRPTTLALDAIVDQTLRRNLTGSVASGFEEFRQSVVRAIKTVLEPPTIVAGSICAEPEGSPMARVPPSLADRSLAICVNAEQRDKALGQRVIELLSDLGAEVLVTPEPSVEQVPADFHAQLDDVIRGSEGMIIVYGMTPAIWVQAQYVRARKILAQDRQRIWGALLDGPPPTKPAHGVVSPNIMPLDCRAGVDRDQIARFVGILREAAHA